MLPLSDIASPKRGLTYKADQLSGEVANSLAYFNMKSFLKSGGLNVAGTKSFSGLVPPDFVLGERDVLIANTDVTPGSDIIGSSALVPSEHIGKSTFSHHVTRLRVVEGSVEPSFLARALLVQRVRHAMRAESRGTTVKMLDMSGAMAIKIGVLPRPEQFEVVSILDTLDAAIHETEAIIAKLKAVKQGLLHDLLTRGVDANGELRPIEAEATHLYKQSALDAIPKEWMSSSVPAEFAIDSGITLGAHRVPRNRPRKYLRVANVHRDRLELDDIAELEASDSEAREKALAPDDLLIVEGHANTSEIGRCAVADEQVSGMLFQNHLFRLRATRLLPAFALLWLNSGYAQAYWRRHAATSSGLNTINRAKLSLLQVVVPPPAEQRMIAERKAAIATRIEFESQLHAKLKAEKSGLMDDLLTGRVRVTPLLVRTGQMEAEGSV